MGEVLFEGTKQSFSVQSVRTKTNLVNNLIGLSFTLEAQMIEMQATLSPGELVGHYRIVCVAGAGGMGMVYKAFDQKLQRTVALKFLPSSVISNTKEKDRFLREARAASSLDHPNIGVIHGVE
jgi:serine/threonine protein kinase